MDVEQEMSARPDSDPYKCFTWKEFKAEVDQHVKDDDDISYIDWRGLIQLDDDEKPLSLAQSITYKRLGNSWAIT